jgi:hypothetical protein
MSQQNFHNALFWHGGADAMHVFDYIAISVLIACMLLAGAKALHKI